MLIGEKLIKDYTTRKRVITAKGFVRCPECFLIGKKEISMNYIQYVHKIYSTPIGFNRVESCTMKKI